MDEEFGKKLTEAHSNKLLIYARLGIRVTFAAVIVFAGVRSYSGDGTLHLLAGIIYTLVAIIMVLFTIWPIKHLKDYVAYYENGICYCGQRWSFERLGALSFVEYKSNAAFFTKIYMDGRGKRFDVTYIKDAKKQYNRAYSDFYELKKET